MHLEDSCTKTRIMSRARANTYHDRVQLTTIHGCHFHHLHKPLVEVSRGHTAGSLLKVFPIHRDVVTSYLIIGFQVAAQLGLKFSVPLYFQITAHASATNAGAHLFSAVAGKAFGGVLAGHRIMKSGRYRLLTILATLISSSSYILLLLRWHGNTDIWESLYIIPGGFSTGIAHASTFISLTAGKMPHIWRLPAQVFI